MSKSIIEVNKLNKNFILPLSRKKVPAINNLSFSVKEGSVVGFLGANGAGKTTTLKILLELIFQDSGEVLIFGKPNSSQHVKEKLGFLTERPYFYDYLTAREFLKFTADLFSIKHPKEKIKTLLEEVGLSHAADRPLRRFSKGMLQRIGIAQALINTPSLLILDEPMSGLDPDGRAEISKIIAATNQSGTTVLFSSHQLPDVENLCDRVVMIDRGHLIAEDTVKNLLESQSKGFFMEFIKKDLISIEHVTFKTKEELQSAIDRERALSSQILKVDMLKPKLEEVYLNLQKASR
jgi:ABC-2 type transport system ATP-binding protein